MYAGGVFNVKKVGVCVKITAKIVGCPYWVWEPSDS